MVNTNHFQGGTITYKIVDTNGSTVSIMITQTYTYKWALIYCDNSYILSQSTPNITGFSDYNDNLTCISNCTTAGGYKPVPVRAYCTDYSSAMAISVTQRTDIVNLTIGAYFTVAFVSSAWRTLSLPTGNSTSKGWSISCTIDLRIRSDTGKPNTPPVANMISPISIPVGNRTTLVIPTIDGDNDEVRCRFANTTTECSSVCPPASLPNNTVLISSNCTLIITGANVNDWYAVAIQIEDFANSNSTTPLSSVPVQFLINVYALPNCTATPRLYGPFNQTGTCESLQIGQAHSMTLYVENYCSSYGVTIKDIAILSFPIVVKSNITQNTSTLYSVSLTWTPSANQVGSQILCGVAIDSQNVQSNQYCVTFAVSENNAGACPGEVLETTTFLTTTEQIFDKSTSFINTFPTYTDAEQSSADNTLSMITTTIYLDDVQSSADDTSLMTTTTIISTTSSSSSNKWPWLLPVIAVLASLLPLVCCFCLCCPPPYGLGLLYRTYGRDRSSKLLSSPDQIPRLPRMYMMYRAYSASSRSTTVSDKNLDSFPLTLRNIKNKNEKNAVWVYPSPRFDNISRCDSSLASLRNITPSDKHLDSFPLTLRNNINKNGKNVVWVHPSPRPDNVSGRDSNSASSRSTTTSIKYLDLSSSTSGNNTNEKGKNIVWVHPSL